MMLIRYLAWFGATLCVLFLTTLGVSALIYPASGTRWIDTEHVKSTLYWTEPKIVAYGLAPLASERRKIILLGSSNVREGLRPDHLAEHFPDQEIHNLAIGASNLSQIAEVVDHVLTVLPPEASERTTFVFGIWYGLFVPDRVRWNSGPTDLDREFLRYGLYTDIGGGRVVPVYEGYLAELSQFLLRPFLFLSTQTRRLKDTVVSWIGPLKTTVKRALGRPVGEARRVTGDARDTAVVTPERRQRYMEFYRKYLGPVESYSDEQFRVLADILGKLSARGAQVLVVDLPLPKWHVEVTPYMAKYQDLRSEHLMPLWADPQLSYIDLSGRFPDESFYDATHPRPRLTSAWSQALADGLAGTGWFRSSHQVSER